MKTNTKTVEFNIKHTMPIALKRDLTLLSMGLPAIIIIFVFNYLPMGGIILAFKNFRVDKGIWGSDWNGLKNFKFFFVSDSAWRVTFNTVFLNFLFIIIGMVVSIIFAFLIYEVANKTFVRVYQTIMFFPFFMSWVVVGYMLYSFLSMDNGLLNHLLQFFGKDPILWYSEPGYWPVILVMVSIWRGTGYSSIIFYAGLMGIDHEYYDAAAIDGASKLKIITRISLPLITPIITIVFLLSLGGIIRSDFGMFFQLTKDSTSLYPTTDVIDTYVYRALRSSNDLGMPAAIGLYQSVVGFVLVVSANFLVKKVNTENALF